MITTKIAESVDFCAGGKHIYIYFCQQQSKWIWLIKFLTLNAFPLKNSQPWTQWWNCWIDICRNHKNILRKIHFQPVCFPFLLAHIIHTHTHHFWLIESTLCCILSEILTCHAVKQQTFTKHTMQIIIFCLSYWIASSALPLLN